MPEIYGRLESLACTYGFATYGFALNRFVLTSLGLAGVLVTGLVWVSPLAVS